VEKEAEGKEGETQGWRVGWENNLEGGRPSRSQFLAPLKASQPFTSCLAAGRNAEDEVAFSWGGDDRVIVKVDFSLVTGQADLVNVGTS